MRDRTHSPLTAIDRKARTNARKTATEMARNGLSHPPATGFPKGGTYNGTGKGTSQDDGVGLMAQMIRTRLNKGTLSAEGAPKKPRPRRRRKQGRA